jgi:hypothetical protein
MQLKTQWRQWRKKVINGVANEGEENGGESVMASMASGEIINERNGISVSGIRQ